MRGTMAHDANAPYRHPCRGQPIMSGLLDRFLGRWAAGPSIYEHIRSHVPATGPGLTEGGAVLPDEGDLEGRIRFAPGALDGVGTHHFGVGNEEQRLDEVFQLVQRAVDGNGGATAMGRLEERLRGSDTISYIDQLLPRIQASHLPADRIEALGRRLATQSGARNSVKLGIALLGIVQGADNRNVLMTLGRHEEFTLFSAVALANSEPEPDLALWELAKLVEGWGRVHIVERLKDTQRREIRHWILRGGFRNQIMNEYLAYIAATTGGLAAALDANEPDDEVLTAASDIVSALISGGPAEGIDDYRDAPRAVELLMRHLDRRASTLHHFLAIDDIERFLSEGGERWPEREEHGWSQELREVLLTLCRGIKARPMWIDLASRGLEADDPIAFYEAQRAARALGIDTFDAHLRRVTADPLGADWYGLMQVTDDGRIDQVVDLAQRYLPLDEIASGPSDALGLGPEFRTHMALGFVIQDLRRLPGHGWRLVAVALRSPVVSNRNAALNALDAWGQSAWPSEALPALQTAARDEPNSKVRERIEQLLRGEQSPEPRIDVP
jgi:hypothetical protein